MDDTLNALSGLACVICDDCRHFGCHEDWQEKNEGQWVCPECGYQYDDGSFSGPQDIRDDRQAVDMTEFFTELMTLARVFNMTHGYNTKGRRATHNLIIEIDLHGRLDIRLIDWAEFYKDNPRIENYTVASSTLNEINDLGMFDLAAVRDALYAINKIIIKLELSQ